jgi:hypothetical protein
VTRSPNSVFRKCRAAEHRLIVVGEERPPATGAPLRTPGVGTTFRIELPINHTATNRLADHEPTLGLAS